MPAIKKQRIHLRLITNSTKRQLLIRHLESHRALAMSLSLLKASDIRIASVGVHHLPLAFGEVALPHAPVGVLVGVGHGAETPFLAGDPLACVSVAG